MTANQIFDKTDNDTNGLDLKEFTGLIHGCNLNLTQYEIQIVFDYIDGNNNKTISKKEFLDVMEDKNLRTRFAIGT